MKNKRACNIHKKFSLQQESGKVSKSRNLQGPRLQARSPSSLMPVHGWFNIQAINRAARSRVARALIAACALLLLLFSCIGAVEGIANAQANAPHVLSVPPSAMKPTRTPPGRHSPTPTTPTPSPTLAFTPTAIPTALANATPSIQGATPRTTQKQGGNPMPTSITTQPTPSTTSTARHTSSYQQKGNSQFLFVIIVTLIGIGSVILILVTGLLLLRKYLLPSAMVRVPPSGAHPWQRARIDSLDYRVNIPGHSLQTLQTSDASSPALHDSMPTTDGYLPSVRNVISSRKAFSSITSNSHSKKSS